LDIGHRIALDLASSLSAEDRYDRLMSALLCEVPAVTAMIAQRRNGAIIPVLTYGFDAPEELSITGHPLIQKIAALDVAARLYEGELMELWTQLVERPGCQALVGIPLRSGGELAGIIVFGSTEPDAFDHLSDDRLVVLGALAAAAVFNARIMEELEGEARRLEQVGAELQRQAGQQSKVHLTGTSAAVTSLREAVSAQAKEDAPLLITGPRGSGKEAAARAVHTASRRADEPFIAVDGVWLRQQVARSPQKPFQLVQHGTLYIKSLERISRDSQEWLKAALRGEQPTNDARIVVSTTIDMKEAVQSGRIDRELAELLRGNTLRVPSLRERTADLPVLVNSIAAEAARRVDRPFEALSPQAMRALEHYRWPGNIDELVRVIERAVINDDDAIVDIDPEWHQSGRSLGRYRLLEKIGQGGMGEVWRATHHLMSREVAVKLIRSDLMVDPKGELTERFLAEAQVTGQLKSPHTVELYDFGVSDTGAPYYVMQYLRGMDLQAFVERFGAIPAERAMPMMVRVARSLAEAHSFGLMHRDIKPSNIFLLNDGYHLDHVKMLDFGMVRAGIDGADDKRRGTPAFMAPEVAVGGRDYDARSDIYSFGCTAYWLVTGELVFEGNSAVELLLQHARAEPDPPSEISELEIPEALEDLILECLEKDPDKRPQSMTAIIDRMCHIPVTTSWTRQRAEVWWQTHAPSVQTPPLR